MFSLPVLILYVRDDFSMNYTQSGIVWMVLIIIMTLLSIVVGLISDGYRHLRYPLMFFGTLIMITGWFIISLASSYHELILIFAFIGIGASGFHPPAMAMLTEMFEEDKGKALSFYMVIGMSGNAIAPLIFAGFTFLFDKWHLVSIALASVLSLVWLILIIISSLTGMFKRFIWFDEQLISSSESINNSKIDLSFLLSPLIIIPILFISIRLSFFRTSSLFTTLLYEDYLSLSKEDASIAAALVLGVSSLFIVVGGIIADMTHPRVPILLSSVGTFVSAFALVFFTDYSNIISFTIFYLLLNSFYFIGVPAVNALLADRVSPDQRGKLFGSMFSLGQIFSLGTPVIFGWIKDTSGLTAAFGFILGVAMIALIIGIYIFQEERSREGKHQKEL